MGGAAMDEEVVAIIRRAIAAPRRIDSQRDAEALAARIATALHQAGRIVPPANASVSIAPVGEQRRILVVEDDPLNAELLRRHLEAAGYAVDDAASADAAVKAAAKGGYHLILLDLTLPGASGLTAASTIRQGSAPNCNVPIVAVSGRDEPGARDLALASGINDFLLKPVSRETLYECLHRHVPTLPIKDPRLDGYALSVLLRDVGPADLARFLGRFLGETRALVDRLPILNRDEIVRSLHTLKGSARSFGAVALASTAAGLEAAERSGSAKQDVHLLGTQLTSAIGESLAAYQAAGISVDG